MVLKVGEEKWHLHFHTQNTSEMDETREEHGQKPLLWQLVTTCLVHTGQCIMTVAPDKYCVNGHVGVSNCSKKDHFVKRVGHRLALTRAIEKFPEATRRAIWQAYWLKVRRPKEKSDKFRKRVEAAQKAA